MKFKKRSDGSKTLQSKKEEKDLLKKRSAMLKEKREEYNNRKDVKKIRRKYGMQ